MCDVDQHQKSRPSSEYLRALMTV